MHRAEYGAEYVGHFGLNLPHYVHASSPIRRYADLVTQRQIPRARLGKGPSPRRGADQGDRVARQLDARNPARPGERAAQGEGDGEGRAGDRARRLDALAGKDFERALKVVVRSGADCRSTSPRCSSVASQTIASRSFVKTLVLLEWTSEGPRWAEVRQAMVNYLARQSHEAVAILTMAKDLPRMLGGAGARSGVDRDGGGAALPGDVHQLPRGQRGRRGAADQGSPAAGRGAPPCCPIGIAGPGSPPPPALDETPPEPPPPTQAPVVQGQDPIMALQEYAQREGTPLPSYLFKQTGPSHLPPSRRRAGIRRGRREGRAQASKRRSAQPRGRCSRCCKRGASHEARPIREILLPRRRP